MKIDKTALTLGVSGIATVVLFAVASLTKRKRSKSKTAFEIDKDTAWMLECLDDMVTDIKQSHKRQDEQEKRLARLEDRIENVNCRLDNIMGGK